MRRPPHAESLIFRKLFFSGSAPSLSFFFFPRRERGENDVGTREGSPFVFVSAGRGEKVAEVRRRRGGADRQAGRVNHGGVGFWVGAYEREKWNA